MNTFKSFTVTREQRENELVPKWNELICRRNGFRSQGASRHECRAVKYKLETALKYINGLFEPFVYVKNEKLSSSLKQLEKLKPVEIDQNRRQICLK